jgi:phosphate transport system ATP-binding protein
MYKLETRNANLWYGEKQALKNISIGIETNTVTALIGPSGCGKSTLLRCFNRMNDLIENTKIKGEYLLDNQAIYEDMDVYELRKRVGMVFQRPNPFPKTIFRKPSSKM